MSSLTICLLVAKFFDRIIENIVPLFFNANISGTNLVINGSISAEIPNKINRYAFKSFKVMFSRLSIGWGGEQ